MKKQILVVGGNSGIGLATVKNLLANGLELWTAARHTTPLEQLGVRVQPFDAEHPSPLALPDSLDGLIYFPGSITLKPFHRLTDGDFLRDYQVNLLGAVSCIRSALPALKSSSSSSSIVLFSTVATAQGMPFHASISAAKSAVEGLALSLAAELAPKIRVNVIAPSLTDTPLASALLNSDAKREAAARRHPLQRLGSPDEMARLVSFLLSDDSSFLTGQVIRADGGLSSLRTF
jgi:3-oxoacyl-[acyl-carrier protein] reductase